MTIQAAEKAEKVKYPYTTLPPRCPRDMPMKTYRSQVDTWLAEKLKDRNNSGAWRRDVQVKQPGNTLAIGVLTLLARVVYGKGRRLEPIELTHRLLAVLANFYGPEAREKAKALLDWLIDAGYLVELQPAAGPRGALYQVRIYASQPPCTWWPLRPQTATRINTKQNRDSRGRWAPGRQSVAVKRPHNRPLKKEGGKESDTEKNSPKTEVGKMAAKAAEMFKPGKCKNPEISNSSPVKAEDGKASQPVPAPQSPSPSAPSMPPSAPTARVETAPEPITAAPDSSKACPTAPAVDPALAAVQAHLDAARQAQGIPAPAAGPSIAEVQAKLLDRRRWQDAHAQRKTMQAIGHPVTRAAQPIGATLQQALATVASDRGEHN